MQSQPLLPESQAMFMAMGVMFIVVFLLLLALGVAVMVFLQACLAKVPPEHRRMAPALVWLLLIPCFNIFWSFFVFLKVAQSFRTHFEAEGVTDVGDCGQAIVLAYCILVCCAAMFVAFVPVLGALFGVAALLMLVITLLRFQSLKQRITSEAA